MGNLGLVECCLYWMNLRGKMDWERGGSVPGGEFGPFRIEWELGSGAVGIYEYGRK